MNELTQARLKELLHYEPLTGAFTWLRSKRTDRIGKDAGYVEKNGYVVIEINRQSYKAHRLAWLWMTGDWPDDQIDHINRARTDNRFVNLRAATRAQNLQNKSPYSNNTSGRKGVTWNKVRNRWNAQICVEGKRRHLGYFDTVELAHAAYCEAAASLHYGEFSRFT